MDYAAIKDNLSDLSEFFSVLAKEKSENRKKLENTIAVLENEKVPEDAPINISEDTLEPQIIRSDLSNLFKNLENIFLETKDEPESESIRGLSFDEQTRLDDFSKLMTSFNSSTPPPIKKVEIVDTVDPVIEEDKLESLEESEEIESIIGYEEEPEEELIDVIEVPEDDYIKETVTQITAQADVYEKPITDFENLQKEFINFKHKVIEQLSTLGGGGATKIN